MKRILNYAIFGLYLFSFLMAILLILGMDYGKYGRVIVGCIFLAIDLVIMVVAIINETIKREEKIVAAQNDILKYIKMLEKAERDFENNDISERRYIEIRDKLMTIIDSKCRYVLQH